MDPRNTKRGGSQPLIEMSAHNGERFDDSKSDADKTEFQQSNDSTSSRILMTHADKAPDAKVSPITKRVLIGIQGIIGILLFAIVLICSVLSKLSLLSITDRLRQLTTGSDSADQTEVQNEAAGLYWQLFFVMVLPNCVTFVRSFVFGVFGKTRKSYPWPSRRALVGVSISKCRIICYRMRTSLVG